MHTVKFAFFYLKLVLQLCCNLMSTRLLSIIKTLHWKGFRSKPPCWLNAGPMQSPGTPRLFSCHPVDHSETSDSEMKPRPEAGRVLQPEASLWQSNPAGVTKLSCCMCFWVGVKMRKISQNDLISKIPNLQSSFTPIWSPHFWISHEFTFILSVICFAFWV